MKAVNLLPPDLRRAGVGAGSDSGTGAYAVIGGLVLLLVVVATWAVSTRQVDTRRAEVAALNAEAQAAEQQAGSLQHFLNYVTVADARRKVVTGLAEARFDWSKALREISTTVPDTAWITSMSASRTPNSSAGGGSNPMRGSNPGPAIEMLGCTTSQEDVALLMARLRSMDSVDSVRLATSEKGEAGAGSSASGGGSGDCRRGDQRPQFNIVVFFKAPAGAPAADGTAQTASTGATQ